MRKSESDEDIYLKNCARYKVKLQRNFYEFVKEAWAVVDNDEFIPTSHVKIICDHLQAVAERRIKRLLISVPPGFAKSLLVCVLYPAWIWTWNPSHRILSGTHCQPLSTRDTVKSRDIINSDWYQYFWGLSFRTKSDQNQKTYYKNDKKGHRVSFSTTSGITGWRGSTIVLDDPLDYGNKYSQTIRDSVNEMIGGALMTRFNDRDMDAMIIVAQRLHCEDVIGFLLKKGGWEYLNLPLEFMKATQCKTSIFTDNRKEGEILWPEKWSAATVKKTQEELGSVEYASQYQQCPTEISGGIINLDWFNYYQEMPNFDMIVDSWDTAFGIKKENDYSVGTTWGITKTGYYLLNVFRSRVGMPDLKRAIVDVQDKFKSNKILVEDMASGKSVVQELTHKTKLPFKLIKPDKCKITRAQAAAPTIEAGKVFLPEKAAWLFDFKEEIKLFPAGGNDDQVDSVTQFINHQTKYERKRPGVLAC